MKFLTTKEANSFGIPSRIQLSGLLFILGAIVMYWSMSLFFVFGERGRTGAIMLGALLIGIAALLRTGPKLQNHFLFLLWATVYFVCLLGVSKVLGHFEWFNTRALIYIIVSFVIFVCGYLLGSERPAFNDSVSHWLLVPVALACAFNQLLFARSMQSMDILARRMGGRGDFGAAEFNPIAVAFATGCLAAIFLGLALVNRNLTKRIIFFLTFSLVTLMLLTTASRGAVLWITVSFVLALIMIRKQNYFSSKHKAIFAVVICVALIVTATVYNFNTALSTRVDILVARFSQLLSAVDNASRMGIQGASSGRWAMWQGYFADMSSWLPFGQKNFMEYPHNLWLECLVRYGFFGLPLLFLLIFVMGKILIDIFRGRIPGDGEFVVITLLFLFAYMSNTTSLTFSGNRGLFVGLGYLLGYYVSLKKRRQQAPPFIAPHGRPPHPLFRRPAAPAREPNK